MTNYWRFLKLHRLPILSPEMVDGTARRVGKKYFLEVKSKGFWPLPFFLSLFLSFPLSPPLLYLFTLKKFFFVKDCYGPSLLPSTDFCHPRWMFIFLPPPKYIYIFVLLCFVLFFIGGVISISISISIFQFSRHERSKHGHWAAPVYPCERIGNLSVFFSALRAFQA